jgi:hypothetical protein
LALSKRFHDGLEVDEGDEHEIEFVKATEYSPEDFMSAEQPLDLIAAPIQRFLEYPGLGAVRVRVLLGRSALQSNRT